MNLLGVRGAVAGAGHLHGASKRHLTVLMALPVAGLTALRLESAYTVFLSFSMYFVAFCFWHTALRPLRFGVAATIALACWLIFMAGIGFDVAAHGGIALFIGAPMVGMRWAFSART